jgi:hypothetical protein
MSQNFKPIKYRKGKGMNTCQYQLCTNRAKFLMSGKVVACTTHYRMLIDKSNTGYVEKILNKEVG